jgi:hypothetical protein
MKTITLEIEDNHFDDFLEVIKPLGYVHQTEGASDNWQELEIQNRINDISENPTLLKPLSEVVDSMFNNE